jgi:hypothetical protein
MTRLFKQIISSWKKSTLTVFVICLIVSFGIITSCSMPRMDFSFTNGGSDDGSSQGGGGGGDDTGSGTAQVTLEWDSNTEPDLDGYKLYYGTSGGIYDFVVDAGTSTTCTVINLTPGETYYFAATAYNTLGVESTFSNEIMYSVPM